MEDPEAAPSSSQFLSRQAEVEEHLDDASSRQAEVEDALWHQKYIVAAGMTSLLQLTDTQVVRKMRKKIANRNAASAGHSVDPGDQAERQ